MTGRIARAVVGCCASGLVAAGAVLVPVSAATPARPPAVIAVMGEKTVNALHVAFRTKDGRDPVFPAGMPRPVRVTVPRGGSFDAAIEAARGGPLGRMRLGTLYHVAGTRLLVYSPPDTNGAVTDLFGTDRLHGTGVTSSAIGPERFGGTNPDALAVFVTTATAKAYEWVAAQPWIDFTTQSSYALVSTPRVNNGVDTREAMCTIGPAVRKVAASGRIVFGAAGNTADVADQMVPPTGLPETYQVGGVDKRTGKTWLPGHPEEKDPAFAAGNVTRPYQTGEWFSYDAAAPDSFDGRAAFGGTSGATPRTAGWAARLVSTARALLRSPARNTPGLLAVAGPGARRPAKGPLADGRLTAAELAGVLRHTATPAEPASPGRYYLEGYGAVSAKSVALAEAVLAGAKPQPARPDEDAAHAATVQVRAAMFNAARCG